MQGLGPHLMLDAYGCERSRLEDLDLVYRVLDELPSRIGMTKIMPPYVFRYSGLRPEDRGISGFVLIAESHVSIHTFPEKRYFSLDILSGKAFDSEWAVAYARAAFRFEKVERKEIDRGTEYPKGIASASRRVRGEREALGAPAGREGRPRRGAASRA